jgi:eukaryotic-like serine/threonine-protein kinase
MVTVGTCLGRYFLSAPLGAGGMGEVFRAQDALLGREVAVKMLPERFATDPNRLARFEREAKSLAALSHPNILAIYDYGTESGVPFAITELLTGETLRERLRRSPLPWTEALEVALAVAEGLAAAHGRGIVHRDLKPDNLFVTAEGVVKILDFGLAQVQEQEQLTAGGETVSYIPALTASGAVLGTTGYMAPEQLSGQATDARADLFALGCVLYEMISGRPTFRRRTAAETYAATLRDEPPALELPAPAAELIRRCLAKAPDERFASARALASALRDLLAASPTAPVPPRRPAPDSLAVLPFSDVGACAAPVHLGEAIAEGVIDQLSRFPRLRVAARAASFRFQEPGADPQSVGRALGVGAVLIGRVQQRSGRLNLRVELIDVADGARLWTGDFPLGSGGDLSAEAELSEQVAEDLCSLLSGGRIKQPRKRVTTNPDARRLYLRARYHFEKRTEEDFSTSRDCYREAIALDPDFALAYAGLAELHAILGSWGTCLPKTTFPLAAQLARRALDVDPSLAEAHTALAYVHMSFDWDWHAAEAGFRHAINLNPNYATAHARYAYLLMLRGRLEEALGRMRHAQQLDPLSLVIRANIGYVLYFMQRYEEAVAEFQAALTMDPRFPSAYYYLGLAFEQKSEWDRAVAAFQEAVRLSQGVPGDIHALGHAHARAGRLDQAEEVFRQLLEISSQRYVPSFFIGSGHLALGRLDEGFGWLERALNERDFYLIYLPVDPRFEAIRHDPRFGNLVRRIDGTPAEAK